MLNMYKQITIHTLKDQGEKNTTIARQLGGPCTHLPYQISPFQREPCLPAGRKFFSCFLVNSSGV